MEIFIEDILENGLTVQANNKENIWLDKIMKQSLGEQFKEGKSKAELVVTLINCDENIDIQAKLTFIVVPVCDRCLEEYSQKKELSFHTVMSPLYKNEKEKAKHKDSEVELVKEDLEFCFYEGNSINLSDIIKEQLLLNEPIKHLCKDECKGLCQQCGKDLNLGACNCEKKPDDSTWGLLKNFKSKNTSK